MVNALASFDPIGAYQGAKERQLGIQAKEADLALQPQRNELSQLQLQQARQGLETASLNSQQQKALTANQFIINANQALLGLPLADRPAAVQAMTPVARNAGIDVGSLDPSKPLTDDVLNNAIQSASTIVQTLQGGTGEPESFTLSPGQRRFQGGRL
jgi:hypothetical protein